MELEPRHVSALVESTDARTVDLGMRGRPVTAVYRPVDEQRVLRRGRTLGSRLGIYQVLQALPRGEWVPVDALTEREQSILPAVPAWTRRRRNRQVLRLADVPVHLDLLVVQGENWRDVLGGACVLGAIAPRMALCHPLGGESDHACLEAAYHGVGLSELRDEGPHVLVPPRLRIPETIAPLHWQLAEQVFARVGEAREDVAVPTPPRSSDKAVNH